MATDTSKAVPAYKPKGKEEYMNPRQLAHFRGILEDQKRELSQDIDRTVHTMQDEATIFADPNDRATQESDMSLELRNRDRERKLIKKIEGDPEFDTKRAQKKLRKYVESHDHAIRLKAEIMVDHFHDQVIAAAKIGGEARAMVICNGIGRAIQYFHAFKAYLAERKSPHRAIVAFSGEHEYDGAKVTEASLNGFPSSEIAAKIQTDPYRFLICADKFQTGYDEPLLHTMYVDKPLSGIKAVQTLSRLNRAHPRKHDCFVLDFQNNAEAVTYAFQDYYRTTLLAEETDPNKLHDLKAALDAAVDPAKAIDPLNQPRSAR